MIYQSLIVPFLITWGFTTTVVLLLTLTDTCDAQSMFSRRES